jgi:hypothetical protein
MAYFTLILDTIGPASPTIDLGGTFTANPLVTATIGTTDTPTTGYEMKFWGNIDPAWAKSNGILPAGSGDTEVTEANALWVAFATTKQLRLNAGDGMKTVNMKLRDDVYNESSQVSDSISLDATLPTVTIVNGKADVDKVSANTAKNTANFSFYSTEDFVEFKVCFVTTSGATHDQGTVIGTAGGSSNTSGTAGNYKASTNYSVVLKGADIQAISSTQNGSHGAPKGIKVFVKDASGQWSA